mmetsp:Transcript_25250/g.42336  ORF Transcript_25250/g.42336 Transcript_25250/m.42336 type:complete len:586 (+) Transcript_25250:208-1965(+)
MPATGLESMPAKAEGDQEVPDNYSLSPFSTKGPKDGDGASSLSPFSSAQDSAQGDAQRRSSQLKILTTSLLKRTRNSKREPCELKPMLERLNFVFSSPTKAFFQDIFTLSISLGVIGTLVFLIVYASMNQDDLTNSKTSIDTSERAQITAPNIAVCSLVTDATAVKQRVSEARIYSDPGFSQKIQHIGEDVPLRDIDVSTVDMGLFGNSTSYRCNVIKPEFAFAKSVGSQPLVFLTIDLDRTDVGLSGAFISLFHPEDDVTSGAVSLVSAKLINLVTFTLVETQNDNSPVRRSYDYTVATFPFSVPTDKDTTCRVILYPATYVTSFVQTKQNTFIFLSNLGGFLSVFEFGFAILTLTLYWLILLIDKCIVKRFQGKNTPEDASLLTDTVTRAAAEQMAEEAVRLVLLKIKQQAAEVTAQIQQQSNEVVSLIKQQSEVAAVQIHAAKQLQAERTVRRTDKPRRAALRADPLDLDEILVSSSAAVYPSSQQRELNNEELSQVVKRDIYNTWQEATLARDLTELQGRSSSLEESSQSMLLDVASRDVQPYVTLREMQTEGIQRTLSDPSEAFRGKEIRHRLSSIPKSR